MMSLLVVIIWNPPCRWATGCRLQRRRSFPTDLWFVRNEPSIPSRGPDDVDPRFVEARDPRNDRLLEVRREIRRSGRQLPDGVADRPRHVDAGLLGW